MQLPSRTGSHSIALTSAHPMRPQHRVSAGHAVVSSAAPALWSGNCGKPRPRPALSCASAHPLPFLAMASSSDASIRLPARGALSLRPRPYTHSVLRSVHDHSPLCLHPLGLAHWLRQSSPHAVNSSLSSVLSQIMRKSDGQSSRAHDPGPLSTSGCSASARLSALVAPISMTIHTLHIRSTSSTYRLCALRQARSRCNIRVLRVRLGVFIHVS